MKLGHLAQLLLELGCFGFSGLCYKQVSSLYRWTVHSIETNSHNFFSNKERAEGPLPPQRGVVFLKVGSDRHEHFVMFGLVCIAIVCMHVGGVDVGQQPQFNVPDRIQLSHIMILPNGRTFRPP